MFVIFYIGGKVHPTSRLASPSKEDKFKAGIDSSVGNVFTDVAFDRSIVPSKPIDNWMYVSSIMGQVF